MTRQYLVVGRDAPGAGAALDALATRHWDYMDRFADRLVARGPTLGPDGEDHTGSVHVLTCEDAEAARRFADEEPFQQGGCYAHVWVARFGNLLGGTMWDRPPAAELRQSTFFVARWPPAAVAAFPVADDPWVFLGWLVSDDGTQSIGVAGALDLAPDAARAALRDVLGHEAAIEVTRWQRGGRR